MIDEDELDKDKRRASRKRDASHAAYERSKSQTEHVLLRLGKGSLALLDAARASGKLSRSACVEAWLRSNAPTSSPEKGAVRSRDPSTSIGDEFEALFGGGACPSANASSLIAEKIHLDLGPLSC